MTKFNIYVSVEEPFQYLITGGHFHERKCIDILLNKKIIDESDNLEVSDYTYGWGRTATDKDREEAMDSELKFMFHQGNSNIPMSYKTKTTFVKLIEKC